MPKDRVCGMNVREEDAAGVYEYRGLRYYFCSVPCKKEF